MRSFAEIDADAQDAPPFSNGTEGDAWEANWCERCVHDMTFRRTWKGTGCPIAGVAELGKTPDEWFAQPWRQVRGGEPGELAPVLGDQYHCAEFRRPGESRGEPHPKPEPRGMDGLFDRPERGARLLAQPDERIRAGRHE